MKCDHVCPECAQKHPSLSPAGAPRMDRGVNFAGQVRNPGPVLGHPRGSERSCEGCKGVTDSPANALCPVCRLRWNGLPPQRALTAEEADAYTELLGKFGSPQHQPPDVSAEVGLMGALQDRIHKESGPYRAAKVARVEEPKLVVSCFDARCQCYQCVKDRADEEEDFRDLAKEQARAAAIAKAKDDVYRMSMDILARATVTPEWAAEVEARTGAYGRGLTKAEAAAYEGVLHGFMRDAMKGLGDVIDPPRAGLPSRDEVAAFLEGWWPK